MRRPGSAVGAWGDEMGLPASLAPFAPAPGTGGSNAAVSLGLGMRLHRVHPPQLWTEDRLLQVCRGGLEGLGGPVTLYLTFSPPFCSAPPAPLTWCRCVSGSASTGSPSARSSSASTSGSSTTAWRRPRWGLWGLWGVLPPLGTTPQGHVPQHRLGMPRAVPLTPAPCCRTQRVPACRHTSASSPSWPFTSSCRRR